MTRDVVHRTTHARASIDGTTVAETDSWYLVEGNVYFPPEKVERGLFDENPELTTYCPWKGHASYYNAKVKGKNFENAAWFYSKPFDEAKNIKDYVAFDKRTVDVVEG